MLTTNSSTAQQLARAAAEFEQQRTGHVPRSVTVVLSKDTLVVTLHGALSPAETDLAKTPAGAAQVQEFHRQLFMDSCDTLRKEIERITGVAVRKRPRKSKQRLEQLFMSSRLAPWWRCFCSLEAYRRRRGAGVDQTKNGE